MEIGEEFEVVVTDMTPNGEGVARIKNFPVFIKNVKANEHVKIKITNLVMGLSTFSEPASFFVNYFIETKLFSLISYRQNFFSTHQHNPHLHELPPLYALLVQVGHLLGREAEQLGLFYSAPLIYP